MQNDVPDLGPGAVPLADRSVERALARRRAAYADEVQRLVAASFRLIREGGELEPRVSEIVKAAGLSNQAFYRHFRSKNELLLAVLDAGVRELGGYLRHRMEQAASPVERIRVWIDGLCRQALDPEAAAATRPFALSRARLSELFPAETRESEAQLTALLRGAIEDARSAGELPGADPERDAQTLYDLAMGWMQRALADPGDAAAAATDAAHLVEFALHGLRRGDAGKP